MRISCRWIAALTLCWLALGGAADAQESRQQRINQAIEAAERICLSGSKYKFQMDVAGNVTITKLQPGAQATVSVGRVQATGGVLFQNDDVRRLVDDNIRICMERQWPNVFRELDNSPTSRSDEIIKILDSRAKDIGEQLASYSLSIMDQRVRVLGEHYFDRVQESYFCPDAKHPPSQEDQICSRTDELIDEIRYISGRFKEIHKAHLAALAAGRLEEAKEHSSRAVRVLSELKDVAVDKNNKITYSKGRRSFVVIDARLMLSKPLPNYLGDPYPAIYAPRAAERSQR